MSLLPLSGGLIAQDSGTRKDVTEVGKPYWIYRNDKGIEFLPTLVMPDGRGVAHDLAWDKEPYKGSSCYRARYRVEDNPWVGVAFVLDGSIDGPRRRFDLRRKLGCAPEAPLVLRFYARSEQGVKAKFTFGGLPKDSQAFGISKTVKLTPKWKRYELNLAKADTSAVYSIFQWSIERSNLAQDTEIAELLIDDIYVSQVKEAPRDDD
jgi:hypothetical protein